MFKSKYKYKSKYKSKYKWEINPNEKENKSLGFADDFKSISNPNSDPNEKQFK